MSKPWLPPSKPAIRIKAKDVRVVRDGQRYTASWHVDGDQLSVWSAYGSRVEPIGRHKDLAGRAAVLLGEIVDAR
jgi:hypothetical protein